MIVLFPGTRDLRVSAPFAGRPTDFVVRIGDQIYHANCVWDALGVVAMLAGDGYPAGADVRTTCADCGESLALAVRGGASFPVSSLWRLAQLWFHDRLSPAWRRRTPDEAHAIFAAAGLTGGFWRLDV